MSPERFRRPVFDRIYADLKQSSQIISITGPRRVGKTTLARQAIEALLGEGMNPARIVYFSLDDPILLEEPYAERFFDLLISWLKPASSDRDRPHFLFLDEIQRYERWELFLKKYYDLGYPVRCVISGSASSPIFKKSRESLLGRVKDFHVLPFSFKEFVLYRRRDDPRLMEYVERIESAAATVRRMLVGGMEEPRGSPVLIPWEPAPEGEVRILLDDYLVEGGFPEVWTFPDLLRKQEYLFDNQVQKVIFEDLILATEFRKPENIKAFYLSLIEQPGRELNLERASVDIGVSRPMLEKYFPLLEMTDLVRRLPKFSKRVLKLRRGNVKCYLVDLALRNAILKLGRRVLDDPDTLGYYAENLVFNALVHWPGIVHLSYFRDRTLEVDFVVTLGGGRYLPIEVKYRGSRIETRGLNLFLERFDQPEGLLITQDWTKVDDRRITCLPLHLFLLLFD